MTQVGFLDIDLASADGRNLLTSVAETHGRAIADSTHVATRLFLLRSPWAPGLCFAGGEADPARLRVPVRYPGPFSLAGSGETIEDALTACVGEGVERVSQVVREGDVALTSSGRRLPPGVMPAAMSIIEELLQRASRETEPELKWVRATALADDADVLVPADWCLRQSTLAPLAIPGAALSTGAAAGPTFAAAATRALLELVERDAAALWWTGGRRARPLAAEGLAMAEATRLLGILRQGPATRATWLLDLTTELDIPCIAAISVDRDGRGFACGLGARLSSAQAVRAAIFELCQMELGLLLAQQKRHERGEAALNDIDRRHLARAAGIDADACILIHPLGAPRGEGQSLPEDSIAQLKLVKTAFAHRNVDAVLVDLTRAEFGIPVVVAIAPALQLMPGHHETERLRALIAATGGGHCYTNGLNLL